MHRRRQHSQRGVVEESPSLSSAAAVALSRLSRTVSTGSCGQRSPPRAPAWSKRDSSSQWRTMALLICAVIAGVLFPLATTADPQTCIPAIVPAEEKDDSTAALLLQLLATIVLLCFSALFSGLTLGVMGLDTLSLEIIASSGKEPDRAYATKILPVRKLGNQLLCTLLLGNVMVNVLIAQVAPGSGAVAFVVSTVLITLFAEILPQSVCANHALYVGSHTTFITMFFVYLFYLVSKPLAMFLDRFVGNDPGQVYDRNELKRLMEMYIERQLSELHSGEVQLMVGAIEFYEKDVGSICTPLDQVYMLERTVKLTEEVLHEIWEAGHSRIPVYERTKPNIIGMLFAKDLILIDPNEKITVGEVLRFYIRQHHRVYDNTKLPVMLKYFQSGKSHVAVVQTINNSGPGDPFLEPTGIVTLEDVIEELIRDEILDEKDIQTAEELNRVHIFSYRIKGLKPTKLSNEQLRAVASYMRESVPECSYFKLSVLQQLVSDATVVDLRAPVEATLLPLDSQANIWLYRSGEATNVFTLILNGRAEVITGSEDFRLEMHSWSWLGSAALNKKHFIPDFSARVTHHSRILQFTHDQFKVALRKNDEAIRLEGSSFASSCNPGEEEGDEPQRSVEGKNSRSDSGRKSFKSVPDPGARQPKAAPRRGSAEPVVTVTSPRQPPRPATAKVVKSGAEEYPDDERLVPEEVRAAADEEEI